MLELDVHLPLHDFALEVRATLETDAVVVLGPSGAGKSSLLEAIAGLRAQATGRIVLGERVLLDSARGARVAPHRRAVGWVPQHAALFPHLDVAANVAFATRGARGHAFDEAVAVLELGPLLARHPSSLSGGERQRVAIARALVAAPRLLLLDEPLAALDVELKDRIVPYLLRIRAALGVPMLWVTHHLGEAASVAKEALVLRAGRVVAHQRIDGGAPSLARLLSFDPRATLDNVVHGTLRTVDGAPELSITGGIAGAVLSVPSGRDSPDGATATYSIAAEDVLVSVHPLDGVSARNVLAGEVVRVDPLGDGRDAVVVVVALGVEWRALVTDRAVRALELRVGRQAWLAIKTHSLRRLR